MWQDTDSLSDYAKLVFKLVIAVDKFRVYTFFARYNIYN